jgi:hypothetical protein
LGAAHVRLSQTTLTLDLSNTVPEIDKDLTKQDLGPLSLVAVDPSTQTSMPLGTIAYNQYDRAAYEASAGIVTLPLTPAIASASIAKDIQIIDARQNVLLAEAALRAIPNTPNLYTVEGQSSTRSFQVYNRGAPATGPLPVTVYAMDPSGGSVQSTTQLNTDANGVLSLPVTGTAGGGISPFVVLAGNQDQAPTQGINTQVNTYMYVRALPEDTKIGAKEPTWENVYTYVLANWNAMAPCMDNWLNLNDPTQVKAYAPILKRLTDPANFEDFRFMPVTRDMTPGERMLLYKFLDAPDHAATAAQAPRLPNFADLSRAMRGHRPVD